MTGVKIKRRCAIYTRKSSEEGLEQEFNSLDAQREACEAYIASQRSEGWVLVRDRYDDGGISGGTLERPGLQRLIADIEDGLVDVVVVYKIDRLSRSLADFAKLVEVFDRNDVTFVSVTQSFNTTTSMGRLTLNILLSFAQFEREVTAERIRDKFAASRKKGMWMGGVPPWGYRVENRKLVIDEDRAEHVRWIFARFLEIGSGTELAREVAKRGIRTPRGNRIDKKFLYRMLNNRAYIGEAVHKGQSYPGEHKAIIDRETWDRQLIEIRDRGRSLNDWKRAFILDNALRPCRHNVLEFDYIRGRFSDDWIAPRVVLPTDDVLQTNRQTVESFLAVVPFVRDEGHPDRTDTQRHEVARYLSLRDVLERLLIPLRITSSRDSQQITGLLLQLSRALDRDPNELCTVFRMSPMTGRERGIDGRGEVTNLFQGQAPVNPPERRGEVYPGDRAIRENDQVTVQIHTLDLKRDGVVVCENVPVLAVWVPARLAVGWINQDQPGQ